MHSSPSLPAAQYMFRIGRSSRCGWSKTNVLKPSADIELLTVIRVLSNGISKHNKLSQKFRTPAFLVQIHIFITRKKTNCCHHGMFPWLKTIKSALEAAPRIPLGDLTALIQTL